MASSAAKVLVPEKVSPDGLALLQKTLHVDEKKGLTAEEILGVIGKFLQPNLTHTRLMVIQATMKR